MNIETVNELIASLESAGELSIKEQKFLKLAKEFKQLAAENVGMDGFVEEVLAIAWQGGSTDGSDIQELALKHGLIRQEVYCADKHENCVYDPGNFDDGDAVYFRTETPATDRIVAGIKADGVALVKSAFEEHIQSPSCYQDEVIGMESALSIASQVESQLREGVDK